MGGAKEEAVDGPRRRQGTGDGWAATVVAGAGQMEWLPMAVG